MYDNYNSAAAGAVMIIFSLVILAVMIFMIAAVWCVYKKANRPGWACLIPFYSQYVMCDIAMGKGIMFLILCIPYVNFVFSVILCYKFARSFGKGVGYTLGLIFLPIIFYPMLAFGSAEYIGPQ